MTQWEVVGVIVVLVGLVAAVAKPLITLNGSIVKLNATLDALVNRNHDEHNDINNTLEEHNSRISNHEGRIIRLETHQEVK